MNDTMGIIFSNMHDYMVSELTANRCMGSIPVGGRYRLIDFVLSGFTNAGLETVGVITKNNYQSLMDHLGSGREWDLSRKHGGLVILPPFGRAEYGGMYKSRLEALIGIREFIRRTTCEYVLMADCNMMANIDYRDFIESHKKSGAEISVMYRKMLVEGDGQKDICTFSFDRDKQVLDMLIHPEISGEQNVYINVVILKKEMLEHIISDHNARNLTSFTKDVLQAGISRYKICGYEFSGYASRFDSIRGYFRANMELLLPEVRHALFPLDRPIYTKLRDEGPTRYGLDANVKNSLLADGCIIEGEVENCILFRGVHVAKGARIKNSILMQATRIRENSRLDYVIADKDVVINNDRRIMGFETYPVYIAKGAVV